MTASSSSSSTVIPGLELGRAIFSAVVSGQTSQVESVATRWTDAFRRTGIGVTTGDNPAVQAVLRALLELAGIQGRILPASLEAGPEAFLKRLPELVKQQASAVPGWSPLVQSAMPQGLQRFWSHAISLLSGEEFTSTREARELVKWLVPMSEHSSRSLRHASMVAAFAIADALSTRHHQLQELRQVSVQQGQAFGGRSHQAKKLSQQVADMQFQMKAIHRMRLSLREEIASRRSLDVSEVIRLLALGEVEKITNEEAGTNQWRARVVLMLHDPNAEVRLKALNIIQRWCLNMDKKTDEMKELLYSSLEHCSHYIVDRTRDVDMRVALLALRALRIPALAERLSDADFEDVVRLLIGSRDLEVRAEAALFVNAHVFNQPGIVQIKFSSRQRRRRASTRCTGDEEEHVSGDEAGVADPDLMEAEDVVADEAKADVVERAFNSETALNMLVQYLLDYLGEHLRLTDRVVGAFWGKAPCLWQWSTMVNLITVGENRSGEKRGVAPLTATQRLAVLYVLEASVRRCDGDSQQAAAADAEAAGAKLNDACRVIIPELARLFEICRADEQQMVLLSHVSKMLVEYANKHPDTKVLVNQAELVQELRSAILQQTSRVTLAYCMDTLLALVRAFHEARRQFVKLAKTLNRHCSQLMTSILEKNESRMEDLSNLLEKVLVLSCRGTDVSFGNSWLLDRFIELILRRSAWLQKLKGHPVVQEAAHLPRRKRWRSLKALGTPEAQPPDSGDAAMKAVSADEAWSSSSPPGVPDSYATVHLIETATQTIMWYLFELRLAKKSGAQMVSPMLEDIKCLEELERQLPKVSDNFRDALAEVAGNVRESPCVRFCAFCCFMHFCCAACAVAEYFSIEECKLQTIRGLYDVKVTPKQIEALHRYLSSLLHDCYNQAEPQTTHDANGQRVKISGISPAPSQGTFTYPRFLVERWTDALRSMSPGVGAAASENREAHHINAECSFSAVVIACQMVHQSPVEDIYKGPLGHLVLLQLGRKKPRALQEVAIAFFERLHDLANLADHFAVQYFEMQMETIFSTFQSCGVEKATSISMEMVRQWALRISYSSLERPMTEVLLRATTRCLTPDKKLLPLLEAFAAWIRGDEYLKLQHGREIAESVVTRCRMIEPKMAGEPCIRRFLQCVQSADDVPSPDALTEDALVAEPDPSKLVCQRRISGKKRPCPDDFVPDLS